MMEIITTNIRYLNKQIQAINIMINLDIFSIKEKQFLTGKLCGFQKQLLEFYQIRALEVEKLEDCDLDDDFTLEYIEELDGI